MILTCPECSTRYQAKDAAFQPAGRRVRCAKCGHSWHQEPAPPEAEEAAAPAAAPPEPAPPPEPEPEQEPARARAYAPPQPEAPPVPETQEVEAPVRGAMRLDRFAVAGGWLGLVVVVLLIGWAAVSYRQQVAQLWPQSASLYSALGLPVNVRGLSFTDVSYHREHEDKESVLAVTGKLVNVSGREMAVPPIRVILTGANGHELYHWDFKPEVTVLGAGKSANFLTRLSSPPGGARHLTLEFLDGKG